MSGKHVLISSFFSICAAQLALTGCGPTDGKGPPDSRKVEITAEEYKFTPSEIKAHPGEELNIVLRNQGQKEHSIEFQLPGINANEKLGRNVPPGETAHMTLTAPGKAGKYDFFSPVGDDRERGLEGQLHVESTPSTNQ